MARPKKPSRLEPRKRVRQARSAATLDVILIAAARVLASEGPAAFNTNRVAEVAGVSVGSLYQYFPGKEALVAALVRRHDQAQLSAFEASIEQARDRPLEEAIEVLVTQLIAGHLRELELYSALERLPHLEGASAHEPNLARSVVVVTDLLARRAPRVRRRHLEQVAWTAVHLVYGLTHRALLERPEDLASGELGKVLVAAVRGLVGTLSAK